MGTKRDSTDFIKSDPDAKRVKVKSEWDSNVDLSSIPQAPHVKHENKPAIKGENKPPIQMANDGAPNFGGGGGDRKRRKKYGNSIMVRRGNETVRVHYNRLSDVLELKMCCAYPPTWDSADVEQEMFTKLRAARFNLEPVKGWGFLGEAVNGPYKPSTQFPGKFDISATVPVQQIPEIKDAGYVPKKDGDMW